MKIKETLDCWQSFFATKLPKEKFDIIPGDSIRNSELEDSFITDLLIYIQNVTHDIGETNFKSQNKIMICKICKIEINKSLLYHHTHSKEHRDIV